MKVKDYLYDKKYYLLSIFLQAFFISTILFYTFKSNYLIILALITILIFNLGPLLIEYLIKNNFYSSIKNKELLALDEPIGEAEFLEGRVLKEVTDLKYQATKDKIHQLLLENNEYRDYLSMWVHEIKTPLASSTLLIHNMKKKGDDQLKKDLNLILKDLSRVEEEVDKVLYLSKKDELEKDYKIGEVTLERLVNSAIMRFAQDLLFHKFRIIKINLDIKVFTDPKWLEFIIGQLISNAIKYKGTKRSLIIFKGEVGEGKAILRILDGGLGITEGEEDYIFKKGYTSPRTNKIKSTGFGLYIVKSLIKRLGLMIYARPHGEIEYEGEIFTDLTSFTITFPRSSHNKFIE